MFREALTKLAKVGWALWGRMHAEAGRPTRISRRRRDFETAWLGFRLQLTIEKF